MVRYYREKKDLRQTDLARLSGYSVRLIGKAEAGKPISPEAIEDLAGALSSDDFQIGPQDLISHPEQTAKNYFENLLDHDSNRAWFQHFIDANISIKVLVSHQGALRELAYTGINGFAEYRRVFCEFFLNSLRDEKYASRRIFSSGNEVVVWHEPISCSVKKLGHEIPSSFGSLADSYFLTTKLLFSAGRLRSLEDRIVANNDSQFLKSLRSSSAIDSHGAPWPDFEYRESSASPPDLNQTFHDHSGGSK